MISKLKSPISWWTPKLNKEFMALAESEAFGKLGPDGLERLRELTRSRRLAMNRRSDADFMAEQSRRDAAIGLLRALEKYAKIVNPTDHTQK